MKMNQQQQQGGMSGQGRGTQPGMQWALEPPGHLGQQAIFQLPAPTQPTTRPWAENSAPRIPLSAQNMAFRGYPPQGPGYGYQYARGPNPGNVGAMGPEHQGKAMEMAKQRERLERFHWGGGKPVTLNAEAMIASIFDTPNPQPLPNNLPVQSSWWEVQGIRVNPAKMPQFYSECVERCGGGDLPKTEAVYPLLLTSALPKDVLGRIWTLVNHTMPRQLTKTEFYFALALVAFSQNGATPSMGLLSGLPEAKYPIPRLETFPISQQGPATPAAPQPKPAPVFSEATVKGSSPDSGSDPMDSLRGLGPLQPSSLTPTGGKGGSDSSREPSIHSLDLPRALSPTNAQSSGGDEVKGSAPWMSKNSSYSSLVDKYAVFKEDKIENEEQDEQTRVWIRCFEACLNLLKEASELFKGASCSSVCREALGTEKGTTYVKGLSAIYKVIQRIKLSLKATTFQTDRLVTLLSDIDELWDTFSTYAAGTTTLPSSKLDPREAVLAEEEKNACGICLLAIGNQGKSTSHEMSLEYAGRRYHSPCANFWVNCIDSVLPSLSFPSLL